MFLSKKFYVISEGPVMVDKRIMISIIVPFYNTGKLIKTSVQSLISQTDKRFEVVFVNDGSTDDTRNILVRLLQDKDITYIISDKANGGVSSARNYGMQRARGEFLMFLDADDCIVDNFVERLCREIKEEPDIVLSGHDVVSSDFKVLHHHVPSGYDLCESGKKIFRDVLGRKLVIDVASLLFRKDFLFTHRLAYNTKLPFGEDLEFNLQALYKAEKVNVVDERMSFYVRHSESTTSCSFDESWYGYYISRYDKVFECVDESDIPSRRMVENAQVGATAYICSCICLAKKLSAAVAGMKQIRKQYLSKIDSKKLSGKYRYMYNLMYYSPFVLYVLLKYWKFSVMWAEKIFTPSKELENG